MSETLATSIFFFAVIDPIGTVPVFVAVTNSFDERAHDESPFWQRRSRHSS